MNNDSTDSLNCTLKMASKLLLILAICLFGTIQSAVQGAQVQNRFTDAQIKRIFHRDPKNLPKYETVTLKDSEDHRSKRETRPVEFEVDGKKIQLSLTPLTDNVMSNYIPVWTVETDRQKSSGHTYKRVNSEESTIDGVFYKDINKMATLLAYYRDGQIYYDGIFGESKLAKVVRSVPEKWWQIPEQDVSNDHVVYDVDEKKTNTQPLGESQSNGDQLDEPLDVMYPKLLVVIEYNYFKLLAEDVAETVKYVSTFWNAVNLKYSKLTSPKVKVIVSGVIIAKDDTALRYIYDARNQTDMSLLDSFQLLVKGENYFLTEFPHEVDFKNYDSTMTMTNLNTGVIAGSAFVGKICGPGSNIGFVSDDASFGGLQSATHELGHLLNLPHDGTGSAKDCQGYPNDDTATIMAPFVASVEQYVWSECSKRILQDFATKKAAECMRYPSRS